MPPRAPSKTPLRTLFIAALAALTGCATEPPAPSLDVAPEPARAPARGRAHTDPVTRVRVPLPSLDELRDLGAEGDIAVEETHHDPTLPLHKFRHSIRLSHHGRTAVLIDVWDNPARAPLQAWFQTHLAFLVDADTRKIERPMGRIAADPPARTTGILLDKPRSPQAPSQAIAVLAHGEQVFRVTAIDPHQSPLVKRLFDRIADDIELGVTP